MTRRHPLAPLTANEIAKAGAVVRASGEVPSAVRFVSCALHEATKEVVLDWQGEFVARQVEVVVYERAMRLTTVLLVSLDEERVVSATAVPGAQPLILDEEWAADADHIKADPRLRAALARRGVTDLATVLVEPWPAGNFDLDLDAPGRRLARGVAYVVEDHRDNPYARPIENLVAIVDRDTGDVVKVEDGEIVPVPEDRGRFDAGSVAEARALAPLEIRQPDGPGFKVDDGLVTWGPWRLRVSMHPVEGLVLHEVAFDDHGRCRPVLHRAALSEMVVPYASTAMNHWWKCTFDAGEAGLGKLAGSLDRGCDCLGEIHYLDAAFTNESGEAVVAEQVICLHEEDHGVLWRHRDVRSGTTEVRRSRRFVLSFVATVGSYDYAFYWYLYLDGRIEVEVKLTGIVQTQAVAPGEVPGHANLIATQLAGPHHQHQFSFRLDVCVDGPANAVYEVDTVAEPTGPANPNGTLFGIKRRLLASESAAQCLAAPERGRSWLVVNHGSRNRYGEPVGYRLQSDQFGPLLLAQPSSVVARRAAFATRHLWVTAFDPDERRAAGEFPYQSRGGDGLPAWVAADRPLVDTDLVLWPTVGITHFCRPEDYPIMSCASTGFTFTPVGFFDANPAVDLAPPYPSACPEEATR